MRLAVNMFNYTYGGLSRCCTLDPLFLADDKFGTQYGGTSVTIFPYNCGMSAQCTSQMSLL